jgi:hypothetical protein
VLQRCGNLIVAAPAHEHCNQVRPLAIERTERHRGGLSGGAPQIVVNDQAITEPGHVSQSAPMLPCRHRSRGRTVSK